MSAPNSATLPSKITAYPLFGQEAVSYPNLSAYESGNYYLWKNPNGLSYRSIPADTGTAVNLSSRLLFNEVIGGLFAKVARRAVRLPAAPSPTHFDNCALNLTEKPKNAAVVYVAGRSLMQQPVSQHAAAGNSFLLLSNRRE